MANRGDPPGGHHHVGGHDLPGEDVDDPGAPYHRLGRLVPQGDPDEPGAHLRWHVQDSCGHATTVPITGVSILAAGGGGLFPMGGSIVAASRVGARADKGSRL